MDVIPTPQIQIHKRMLRKLWLYAKGNIAYLKIFYIDPYYTKIIKDVNMSYTSFIGNTGGLMSLCIGLSLISIFEIIFHLHSALMSMLRKLLQSEVVSIGNYVDSTV